MPKTYTRFTEAELAAILAGLRLIQRHLRKEPLWPDDDILTDGGTIEEPIDADAIDALCDRINQ